MRPTELSLAFIDAHNRRDADAMRAMLDPEVVYIRPGGRRREGVDAIIAAYEKEWQSYDVDVHVRSSVEQADRLAAEIEVVSKSGEVLFVGSVFHDWRDDKLVRYRAYFDPVPKP